MARFDFDAALRWARFDPRHAPARREDAELPFVDAQTRADGTLLLDTNVYIDTLQDRLPDLVENLVTGGYTNHSTVAIQELMHTVGVLNPDHPGMPKVISQIGLLIRSMPPHRLFAPDAETLGRAALLAGMLCRLQGYAKDERLRAQHDCVLFLQAQRLGFTVLTRNVRDFDYLLQLFPAGRVLMYREAGSLTSP
ncbi:DNA-binding protein [Labrys miyagiensis]|uniref:DNA-binding protein n=1 Tax=Labrys miyagiensis TaxID=346912 RepID=A0ABQ6CG85_9HYPH|nr:DNA-binding protein [Labrys miyagiensis]GLS17860.1 DNA-binding protein [Labrys miyagiensis]